jgi:hypothetical protein
MYLRKITKYHLSCMLSFDASGKQEGLVTAYLDQGTLTLTSYGGKDHKYAVHTERFTCMNYMYRSEHVQDSWDQCWLWTVNKLCAKVNSPVPGIGMFLCCLDEEK